MRGTEVGDVLFSYIHRYEWGRGRGGGGSDRAGEHVDSGLERPGG